MSKQLQRIDDLTPDDRNANRGTERGRAMLEESLRKYGAGRPVLADRNGKLIAGNKTVEEAAALGFEIEVVRTKGDKLIVHQREDLDLETDVNARMLAYADNRVGQVSLDWDPVVLQEDQASGIDLSGLWFGSELFMLGVRGEGSEPVNPEDEWVGMPEFEQPDQGAVFKVIVNFTSVDGVQEFEKRIGQEVPRTSKITGSIWFPKIDRQWRDHLGYVSDES